MRVEVTPDSLIECVAWGGRDLRQVIWCSWLGPMGQGSTYVPRRHRSGSGGPWRASAFTPGAGRGAHGVGDRGGTLDHLRHPEPESSLDHLPASADGSTRRLENKKPLGPDPFTC